MKAVINWGAMSFKKKSKSRIVESEEGYDLYASRYDESQFYLNSFEREKLFELCDDLSGKKVLDIGAGTGRIVGEIERFGGEVTALDISEKMLKELAKKHSGMEMVKADVRNMPFKDDSFDAAFALFLIVHLKSLDEAFREVYRVLKPGGFLMLTNINQKKAPKLKTESAGEIVIASHYHMPKHVIKSLEENLFEVEAAEKVYQDRVWINQIIRARKI